MNLPVIDVKPNAQALIATRDPDLARAGDALNKIQDRIDRLGELARNLESSLTSALAALSTFRFIDMTLTAATTAIPIPSFPNGSVIVYNLIQDATGGRAVTWATAFVGPGLQFSGPGAQPATDPLRRSTFIFHKKSSSEIRLLTHPLK